MLEPLPQRIAVILQRAPPPPPSEAAVKITSALDAVGSGLLGVSRPRLADASGRREHVGPWRLVKRDATCLSFTAPTALGGEHRFDVRALEGAGHVASVHNARTHVIAPARHRTLLLATSGWDDDARTEVAFTIAGPAIALATTDAPLDLTIAGADPRWSGIVAPNGRAFALPTPGALRATAVGALQRDGHVILADLAREAGVETLDVRHAMRPLVRARVARVIHVPTIGAALVRDRDLWDSNQDTME